MFNLSRLRDSLKVNICPRVLFNKAYLSIKIMATRLKSIEEQPQENFFPEFQLEQAEVNTYYIEIWDATIDQSANKEESILVSKKVSFLDLYNRSTLLGFVDTRKLAGLASS